MSPGPKKRLLNRDWQLLKTYEGAICRQFDAVLAVSHEDKAALEQAADQPLDNATIIPIAIDTDEVEVVQLIQPANHILHIGTMFWPPNVDGILWFLREVWPIITAQRPDVVFDVVGARPPADIETYGQQDQNINVTGYVDDPAPYYQQAGVMIVPLRAGGGMRVKILNALAQSLPLVSTTIGCEGIAVEHGKHLLIADTPTAFAEATLRLLDDQLMAKTLGRNGRQLIQDQYDYRTACLPLQQIYNTAVTTRKL
jgi:glycosyltransferase involved in cell wall biosynthesis